MTVATCKTRKCPEHGIDKPLGDLVLRPGEEVLCGGCGKPCQLTETDT